MFNVTYFAPNKLSDALDYLSEHKGARILAGGTDLIAKWKKIGHPDMELLDIRNIENFKEISASESGLFIGAGATMDMIQYNEVILGKFPVLAEAAGKVGSVQVRNMATIGGNSCNAAPSADTVLPLIAYGAEAVIVSKNAEKRCPLKKFFVGPGKTILQQGELLKGFYVPYPSEASGAAFAKHSRRVGMDLATVGVAVNLELKNDGGLEKLTVALGAVGPTPIVVDSFTACIGEKLSEDLILKISEEAASAASPITDVRGSREYRMDMITENIKACLSKIAANL